MIYFQYQLKRLLPTTFLFVLAALLIFVLQVTFNRHNFDKLDNHKFQDGSIVKMGADHAISPFNKLDSLYVTDKQQHGVMQLLFKLYDKHMTKYNPPSDADIIENIKQYNLRQEMVGSNAAMKYFHQVMINITYQCRNYKRFGNKMGGGYELCLDPPLLQKGKKCVAFSFGIQNDFSFDDDIGTILNCTVHSFDPSMRPQEYARSNNTYFHNIGVGAANYKSSNGWPMYRFSDIRKILGYGVIDIVKMDIEDSDWPVLRDIVESGEASMFIKQIALEMHSITLRDERVKLSDYLTMLKIMHSLEEAGFRKYLVHIRNNCCGRFSVVVTSDVSKLNGLCCYEIFFVNSKFM